MALFLGIDGGGSKTTCLLGNEKTVLASATAPASNPIRVGEAQSRESLHAAIRHACSTAQVDPAKIAASCVGIAGGARAETSSAVRAMLNEVVGGAVEVLGDMTIALEAAFPGGPGLIVIAGTGSIAYGRNERGTTVRAGGWGFAISDEGSGHWIGRSAVAAAMRAHDTGESTALVSAVMNTWHLGTTDDVVRTANAMPPPDFAGLFPAVVAAAAAGDAMASDILSRAAVELAHLAKTAGRRLWPNRQPFGVAIAGGVFENSAMVRQVFSNSVRSEFPQASVGSSIVDPVQGALYLARKHAT